MNSVLDWYRGRTRREQVMLGAMTIVAVPVLIWLLLIRPIMDWHDSARIDMLEAADRLGRIRTVVALQEGGATPAGTTVISQPIEIYVATSAEQAGFALTQNNPAGPDRTDVTIAQARPDAALGWIANLRGAGIRVERLSMSDNGEGGVAVELTLAKAAS